MPLWAAFVENGDIIVPGIVPGGAADGVLWLPPANAPPFAGA